MISNNSQIVEIEEIPEIQQRKRIRPKIKPDRRFSEFYNLPVWQRLTLIGLFVPTIIFLIFLLFSNISESKKQKKLEKTVAIQTRESNQQHEASVNIGKTLFNSKNYEEALKSFEKILWEDIKEFGPDHPNVANDWVYLGLTNNELGNYTEAAECFRKALEIELKIFGPIHINIARDSYNLGIVLKYLGEYQEAKTHLETALKIDLERWGNKNLNVASDWNNLGDIAISLGKYGEALKYFEQTLKVFNKKLGEDHPYSLKIKKSIDKVAELMSQQNLFKTN